MSKISRLHETTHPGSNILNWLRLTIDGALSSSSPKWEMQEENDSYRGRNRGMIEWTGQGVHSQSYLQLKALEDNLRNIINDQHNKTPEPGQVNDIRFLMNGLMDSLRHHLRLCP